MAEFPSHKNLFAELCSRDMLELSDHKSSYRFEYPKEFLLNQATQKSTCQNFQPPKILKLKISNPKKSFDHPCHLKSRVPGLHQSHFASVLSPLSNL